MKIWIRYLLIRLFSTAIFILICLFGIYLVIDLSIHSVRFFADGQAKTAAILLYYIHSYSVHLDLFFALSFLLSSLKVLFDLTHHLELVALQMAGLSKQRLTLPIFILAGVMSLTSYANAEWLSPQALDSIDTFRSEHAKRKKQAQREHVHALTLDDGTEVIYQRFDSHEKNLFDTYWIKSPDEIWHMKILDLQQTPIVGRFVDHFLRNESGQIVIADSLRTRDFPEIPLNTADALQKFIPFENRPIATLFIQSFSHSADLEMIRSHLHYKIILPLLPVLIALALPPFILRFSRQIHTFLIAACSIFALVTAMTILDGLLILAENRVFNPFFAFWIPFFLSLFILVRRFLKFA